MLPVNTIRIKVIDDKLFNVIILIREREKERFMKVLNELKNGPLKASEIEEIYGNSTAYTLITRLITSGMIEKNEEGKYVLSKKFSEILRRYAKEWEDFVDGL